ncbi:MAG: FxsA family protein [Mariprofundaceae bacterium]|nr:FxsA family protein [Mariprofundaceae bacterium]
MRWLLFFFIAIPLVELYVLIEVGQGIGGLYTIILCVATALLGGLLVRQQGLMLLVDAQKQLAQGQVPAANMVQGIMVAVSGLLLFTPGLLTDTLGFLLLVPAIRQALLLCLVRTKKKQKAWVEGEVIPDDPHKLK